MIVPFALQPMELTSGRALQHAACLGESLPRGNLQMLLALLVNVVFVYRM